MKLQTRFLLSLFAVVLIALALSQAVQLRRSLSLLNNHEQLSMAHEEASFLEMVDNLRNASDSSLQDAMVQGDMDRFRKLMEGQKQVHFLKEFSVLDTKGVYRYSTIPERLKQKIAPDLAEVLFKNPASIQKKTADTFDIYQPLKVTAECMECHKEYKDRVVGGVFIYRYSLSSLNDAQSQWTDFREKMSSSSIQISLYSTGVILVLILALVVWLVRYQIAKPLDAISGILSDKAREVEQAAENISSSSRSLAEGASAQAASTEEASASLEEMASMTRRNADDAKAAASIAVEARQSADQGAHAVEQLAEVMKEIAEASVRMSGTLKVIDEISFQTNILALNAAVEAARAGEAGAGFAVVAEEVRNLALRSAESAKAIAEMMAESSDKTRRGGELSELVKTQLTEILGRVIKEAEMIEQIARASQEQQQGISQITEAVHQIDTVTQQNAAGGEESAAMARELESQAQKLKEEVSQLDHLVHGAGKS